MSRLIEDLMEQGPVLTDGAWGTQMQERGLGVGESADLWNLSHPDRVEEVARTYVAAGSRIVLTNTFQANRYCLERHGAGAKAREINRAGAEISKRAAGDGVKVFASVGPSGKMLMMGEVSEEDLRTLFREQMEALALGGADAIVIETMSDTAEAALAVSVAKEVGLPVVASLCFDSGKDCDRTMMGVTPEQGAAELTAAGADAIGANCGQGIEGYISICERLRKATDLPIWIKANAGLPELIDGAPVYTTSPEKFAESVPALANAGASFIGGCCGTSPEFIAASLKAVRG